MTISRVARPRSGSEASEASVIHRAAAAAAVQAALGFPPQVSSPWYVVGDCTSPNGVDVGLMKDEEDDHQHLPDDPKPSVTA